MGNTLLSPFKYYFTNSNTAPKINIPAMPISVTLPTPKSPAEEKELVDQLMIYCHARLPEFSEISDIALRKCVADRLNPHETDYELMYTLSNDGYGDIVHCIYDNIPYFWSVFSTYKKENNFCWNCAYNPQYKCPMIDNQLRPTSEFKIIHTKIIRIPFGPDVPFDKNGNLSQNYDSKYKPYFTSCWCEDKHQITIFNACKFCIGNNADLFQ